jgi:FMN phosphatase YigB (HAD superfamily)
LQRGLTAATDDLADRDYHAARAAGMHAVLLERLSGEDGINATNNPSEVATISSLLDLEHHIQKH